ncbi:MAG: O-antigen ligase family protein, partial [Bacteroidales bacterium]|nr:O-antigen ligase family protein [Bacteroidales bacterium]
MSSIKKNKIIEDIFIIILIVIIPLIYTRKTPDNQIIIRFILLSISLFFFSLLLYLKSIKNKKLHIKSHSFYFFLLLIIYTIISGIGLFYTVNLTDGIFAFSKIVLLGILITLLFLNFNDPNLLINKLTKAFTVLGFFIIIIGMYQLIDLSISESINHNNLYKITATFGHKNIFAQILLLCFPFSVYMIFEQRVLWKSAGIFNTLFIVILLTILMTRSVWIAGILAFIVTSVIGIFTIKPNYLNLKKLGLYIIPLIILIFATAILYSKFDQSSAFRKQISKTYKFNYGSTKDRIILWEKSLELVKEKPLFGHGAGSWKINILKYGNQNLKSEDNLTFYQRPHNDFLWILCEQGIIALICYLSIFLISIYTAIRLLKSNIKKEVKIYVLLMIYALVSYLIFSFFSFPMDRIEFIVFLSYIFASLISLSNTLYPQLG